MESFDPKKLTLLACELVDVQLSSPLLSHIHTSQHVADMTLRRALQINEEQQGLMLFLMISLNIDDDANESMATCDATYRCIFSYTNMAELYESPSEDAGDASQKNLTFPVQPPFIAWPIRLVRGMVLLHFAHTPFAKAVLPILTINDLLTAESGRN